MNDKGGCDGLSWRELNDKGSIGLKRIKMILSPRSSPIRTQTVNSSESTMSFIYFILISAIAVCNGSISNYKGMRFRLPLQDVHGQMEPNEEPAFYYQDGHPTDLLIHSEKFLREDRGIISEMQPLCKEIRTEIPAAMYLPLLENADSYTFRPHKIFMVNCSNEITGREYGRSSGYWTRHCREKYVDIDLFGKHKSVKENLWQLMMEIPSVPIACECFRLAQ